MATSLTSPKKKAGRKDTKEEPTIQQILLARAEDEGITFPHLHWEKLGDKCLELGIQLYNYPNLPEDQQQALIDQCVSDVEHRFAFRQVDVQDLNDDKIPILIHAPDEDAERSVILASALNIVKPKKTKSRTKLKVEDIDVTLPSSQSAASTSRVTRATRKQASALTKDNMSDGHDTDGDSDFYLDDDVEMTPKAAGKCAVRCEPAPPKDSLKPKSVSTSDTSTARAKTVAPSVVSDNPRTKTTRAKTVTPEDLQAKSVVAGGSAGVPRLTATIIEATDSIKRKQSGDVLITSKRTKVETYTASQGSSSAFKGFTNFEPLRKAQSSAPSISGVEFGAAKPTASSSKGPFGATAGIALSSTPAPVQAPAPVRTTPPIPRQAPAPVDVASRSTPVEVRPTPIRVPAPVQKPSVPVPKQTPAPTSVPPSVQPPAPVITSTTLTQEF
ncbi:hypothetical protein AAF712_012736 [Marasmius tenuissimus]|uniref:Uncharacterized protein n=1 Tax=Marasmius tenuissimus TaxID=585030 RepID=A0ABR2ZIA0_9AGAR